MLSLSEDLHNSSNDTRQHGYLVIFADLFKDKTLFPKDLQDFFFVELLSSSLNTNLILSLNNSLHSDTLHRSPGSRYPDLEA